MEFVTQVDFRTINQHGSQYKFRIEKNDNLQDLSNAQANDVKNSTLAFMMMNAEFG